MKVLVTGGAGFIGSFIVDALVEKGHDVRIFDFLEPQVHKEHPNYVSPKAEFIKGDIRDTGAIKKAIEDVEIIFHQAAMVGVGQSMYQIARYMDVNTMGTAKLLDVLVNNEHSVKKIIVAASMSSYGEGAYKCDSCGVVHPALRTEEQMKKREWEQKCPKCGAVVKPIPTPEEKPQNCESIYAMSKRHQEEMVLLIGKTYGIPAVALRYFNVYGPRQSMNNPYTGVCAIFNSRIKNNNAPIIYEDGLQTRDFIHVKDIARANLLVMESDEANYRSFNVGTGKPISILDIANVMIRLHGKNLTPGITNKFRKGDIRHCYADISKIKAIGFEPKMDFEEGMKELVEWAKSEEAVDLFEKAQSELKNRNLVE